MTKVWTFNQLFQNGGTFFQDLRDQKMTGAKKVSFTKNQFFHARQSPEEIFGICSSSGFIFMTEVWNFTRLVLNFVTSEAVLI